MLSMSRIDGLATSFYDAHEPPGVDGRCVHPGTLRCSDGVRRRAVRSNQCATSVCRPPVDAAHVIIQRTMR